jgi:hypothetical protein
LEHRKKDLGKLQMRGWSWDIMNLITEKDGNRSDRDKSYQMRFENFIHSHTPKQATYKHHNNQSLST